MVGRLAEKRAATEQALQGLLVRHGAQDSLMHPSDLPFFTKLHPGRVLQRQLLALHKPFSEVPTRHLILVSSLHCWRHVLQRQLLALDKPCCKYPLTTSFSFLQSAAEGVC